MNDFNIGDKIYAGYQGSCEFYGEIDSIDYDEKTCTIEFETDGCGGRCTFAFSDICHGCENPKSDCQVK